MPTKRSSTGGGYEPTASHLTALGRPSIRCSVDNPDEVALLWLLSAVMPEPFVSVSILTAPLTHNTSAATLHAYTSHTRVVRVAGGALSQGNGKNLGEQSFPRNTSRDSCISHTGEYLGERSQLLILLHMASHWRENVRTIEIKLKQNWNSKQQFVSFQPTADVETVTYRVGQKK